MNGQRTNGILSGARGWYAAGLLSLTITGMGFSSQAVAEEDRPGKIEKLFREGTDLYAQGRFSDAQRKLREMLSLEPNKDICARLVDEAGVKVMAKMMAEPRMGSEPTYIWDQYKKYYVLKLADKDRMSKLAARLTDPATSNDERAQLMREFTELGHYAIPALAPYLGNAQHEDFRTYARLALARMGPVAVNPLIELLEHKEVLMRENAMLALTDIAPMDGRAIAALKARLEDPKESETAKRYAARAIERITGLPAGNQKSAASYYYESANRYYLEFAGVPEESEQCDGYVWHLNEAGDLVPVLYPLWAWNEQMAEKQAYTGARLSPETTDFYPLMACIFAAQHQEVKDLVDIIGENPANNNLSEEEKNAVKDWDKKVVDCKNLAAATGKHYVNEGLLKTLRDMKKYKANSRLPGVAVFLCQLSAELDPNGSLLPGNDAPIVMAPAPVVSVDVASCRATITPARAAVQAHGSQQFHAVAYDGTGKEIQGVSWIWGVESGGTVDQNGVFTAGDVGGVYTVTAQAVLPAGMSGSSPRVIAAADIGGATVPTLSGSLPGEGDMRPAGHNSGLVYALSSEDQNVQYAAALALSSINKFPQHWVGEDKVAAVLGRGISENKSTYILVVDENQNVRNEIRKSLEALGYGMTEAVSGRDALLKAKSFPPKDLIIIGDNLRSDLTSEQLSEELKADVRTRYTPQGILHDRAARTATQARFGLDIPLVEREMKDADLRGAVEKLEAKRAAETVTKRKAHEISVACATSLSNLRLNSTNIHMADAVPNAWDALINRKDDVRIPSAKFIGVAEGGDMKDKAAERLKDVFEDSKNATDLRLAALKSLAQVKPEAYQALYIKAQSDPEWVLTYQAAVNFGKAERTNKELLDLLNVKRIDKDKKEK